MLKRKKGDRVRLKDDADVYYEGVGIIVAAQEPEKDVFEEISESVSYAVDFGDKWVACGDSELLDAEPITKD